MDCFYLFPLPCPTGDLFGSLLSCGVKIKARVTQGFNTVCVLSRSPPSTSFCKTPIL